MASPARRKLIQVDDEYWDQLYARFLNNDPGLEGIISADLYTFLHDLARSKFTTIGMLFPSILTSINYVLGAKGCVVTAGPASQKRNMNNFMIIVGQPSTGKTPALETAAWEPMDACPTLKNTVNSTVTSAGLESSVANDTKMFIINREISGYLGNIFEHSSNDDVEQLCSLYSGERSAHGYAHVPGRTIEKDVAFCILGE